MKYLFSNKQNYENLSKNFYSKNILNVRVMAFKNMFDIIYRETVKIKVKINTNVPVTQINTSKFKIGIHAFETTYVLLPESNQCINYAICHSFFFFQISLFLTHTHTHARTHTNTDWFYYFFNHKWNYIFTYFGNFIFCSTVYMWNSYLLLYVV